MPTHCIKLYAACALVTCAILLSSSGWAQQSQASPAQQAPPQQTTPPPNSTNPAAATPQNVTPAQAQADAAAAERKRRFEALKKQMEDGASANQQVEDAPLADPNQTLFVSPAKVNMLVGQSQPFCVFDINGRDLSGSAQWSLTDAKIAYPITGGPPEIMAKAPGSVKLRAKVGNRVAEAEVTVFSGIKLPTGSTRWQAPAIPGYHMTKIVPAVPSASGVDVYSVEENEGGGSSLVRAFTSEGIQVWMKVMQGKIDQLIPTFR